IPRDNLDNLRYRRRAAAANSSVRRPEEVVRRSLGTLSVLSSVPKCVRKRATGTIRRSGTALAADGTLGLMGSALPVGRAVCATRWLHREADDETTMAPCCPGG